MTRPCHAVTLLFAALLALPACAAQEEGALTTADYVRRAADTPVPPAPAEALNPHAGQERASIVLGGGCFWCTEVVLEQVEGVTEVTSGYAGGTEADATYKRVSAGLTDHAEVIRVEYNPSKVTLGRVLQVFFAAHDPTQLNRQGPDAGRQYRSAIFYSTPEERAAAENYIEQLRAAGAYDRPIATTLEPLEKFYTAEDYHQDYVIKNPRDGYVEAYAYDKLRKLAKNLPELLKAEALKGPRGN